MKKNLLIILTFLIWIGGLEIGFQLSKARPLWNDELHTETESLTHYSYPEIFMGRVDEGNNCPLFYLLQKGFRDMIHFHLPTWDRQWFFYEPHGQIVLRILPNILMSLTLAIIFYYFARFYAFGLGFFALIAMLATPMTWFYWPEARPYGLWIFLTTAQAFLYLHVVKEKPWTPAWRWLALTNILLAFSVSLGIVQVVIISFLLGLFKERRWQNFIFLTVVPFAVSFFYLTRSPKFKFWFGIPPQQLLLENIPIEFCALFLGYALLALLNFKAFKVEDGGERWKYASFIALVLLFGIAFLLYLILIAVEPPHGFGISSRYFIFLVPVSVIAACLCLADCWRVFKNDVWMRRNLLIVAVGFLALRVFETIIAVLASGVFPYVIR